MKILAKIAIVNVPKNFDEYILETIKNKNEIIRDIVNGGDELSIVAKIYSPKKQFVQDSDY